MPGFLSKYIEITRVMIDETYWAEVRRYPRRADFVAAQNRLIRPSIRYEGTEGATTGDIDTGGYQNELVARALVTWNLTDESGATIPLGAVDTIKGPDPQRYAAVDLLPEEVFEKINDAIEGARTKKQTPEAVAAADETFPQVGAGRPLGSHTNGDVAAGAE